MITIPGNTAGQVQGGIYASQNSSTGTSISIFTTDSYSTGPQQSLTVLDNGNVGVNRGTLSVSGNITGANLSGTNTGDETKARINALDITELGTISSGVWQGSAISQTYLTGQSGTNTGDQTLAGLGGLPAAGGTITGGLTIQGSVDSGATNMGYYESVGTNLILKGDSVGRSGIFFESEKDGTNINDPSDYGFIQFHSYGYGNTTGEANNLVIGVSNDSTDKVILQAPYNGGVMIGYKDATSGTGLTLSEVIHSNASSYNNGNWDTAYTHAGSTHAPTNAEQNVQSDWNATTGDALILNKPSIPAASGKGQNIDYIASNLPSSNSTYRDNFGAGVWAYSGYSTGTDRPFTYDATLQVMPTNAFGFELSTSWHSTGEGSLKIRALRDCCEGWGDYHDVWTSDNFANNSANWNSAYGWGDHASAGYVESDSNFLKSNADDTFTGRLSVGSTDARRAGIYGTYDSNRIGHIWSMGTGYMIPSNGSDFGNLYGLAYKHTNNTTGGTMAGGHQMVWADNGTGRSAMGYNGFWTTGTGYEVDDGSYGSCKYGAYYGNILLDGGTGTNSYYVGIPSNQTAQTLYVGGPINADGDVTAFYSSDRRLKENIKPIENSLDKIKKLNGVTFDWIKLTEEEKGVKHQYNEGSDLGVIAQEVEEVLPELVKTRKSGYKAVDYQKLTAVLIEAVKEQQTQIEELKEVVNKLQKK